MKKSLLICTLLSASIALAAQESTSLYRFDFSGSKKVATDFTAVDGETIYSAERGYGYDLLQAPVQGSNAPFFFSLNVPDGNYKITLLLGSKKRPGVTTVRAESRRLFANNVVTRKGEFKEICFTVNKRTPRINEREQVKIKPREAGKLNWDDKLTLELNGEAPCLQQIIVEKDETAPTIFLCGNSTVVDQDNEPWASWGQMIPCFFDEKVCFANYGESGESANTFIAAGRLKKALSQMKQGDYIFIEFGHNDQKQRGPGVGAFYSFMTNLKTFIDEARAKGATPVLVTPTQRRSFDEKGKITDTHADYPDAVRWLAQKESIALIDLHQMTRTLYETLGIENSKKAFVHYPAGTFPNQDKELKDNTHFNPYGAYQIAQCVIEGMRQAGLSQLTDHLNSHYKPYSPTSPDDWSTFHWDSSPFTEVDKPDGN